jgi:hypothetical protein
MVRWQDGGSGTGSSKGERVSQELRTRILLLLEQHARTGSPAFVRDTELAEATGQSVEEIRRQLDILGSEGFIKSANSHSGYNARISPTGSLAIEAAIEEATEPGKPRIGFRTEDSE